MSTCVTKGAACPVANATVWECEDPSNCAGKLCCAHSGDGGTVTIATDTCGGYLSKFSGTRCSTVCAPTTAVKPKGNDIGVCK